MKISPLLPILFFSSFTMSACSAQESTLLPIQPERIFTGQQCNLGESSSAIWINGPQKLESILKQVNRHMSNGSPPQIPSVNFIREAVLAISMGQQRTGGYGLVLTKSAIQVENKTATLKLEWRQPGKNMMSIQILTSPCLFVKIPKGDYTTIRVVTLTGKEIGRVEVK